MGTTYFFVDDVVLPVVDFSRRPQGRSYWDRDAGYRFSTALYLQLATANDQNFLLSWSFEGSSKSGRLEFRDYQFDGSMQTLKFVDGICMSFSSTTNGDSVMLPILISLFIVPSKLIYDNDRVILKR